MMKSMLSVATQKLEICPGCLPFGSRVDNDCQYEVGSCFVRLVQSLSCIQHLLSCVSPSFARVLLQRCQIEGEGG